MDVSPLSTNLPLNAYYTSTSTLDRILQNNRNREAQQNVTSPDAASQTITAANIPAPATVGTNATETVTGPTGITGIGGTTQSIAGITIPQASTTVSIGAGQQPQTLLYRAASDQIGALLPASAFPATTPAVTSTTALQAAAFQTTAIQTGGFPATYDISPTAAASQILTESAGFFEAYVAENPGKDSEQLVSDFIALVRDGFENGFAEAGAILNGLGTLEENIILDDLALTYDLVQQGLDAYLLSGITPLTPELL